MSINTPTNGLSARDFPTLFNGANTASLKSQRAYLRLLRYGLILQVLGVATSLIQFTDADCKFIVPYLSALFFGVSLLLTIILKTKQYEKIWYGGRAAAESVKTSAWRYAMCSEPYFRELHEKTVDEIFIENLRAVIEQRKNLAGAIAAQFPQGPQITDKMRSIRKLAAKERLGIYLEERIASQRDWYARKAAENQIAVERLFLVFIIAQALTLLFALTRIRFPELTNFTGLFAVIGSSTLAWLQIKKHQELAQSYAVTAHELGLVLEKGRHVNSDSDLAIFVGDAENAISREHTLWVARRDSSN